MRHESTGRPSTKTAHVPHSPSSHPCLVPVNRRSSRRTSSRVLCGAKATSVCSPLSSSEMCAFVRGPLRFFAKQELPSLLGEKLLRLRVQDIQCKVVDDCRLLLQPLLPAIVAHGVVDPRSEIAGQWRGRHPVSGAIASCALPFSHGGNLTLRWDRRDVSLFASCALAIPLSACVAPAATAGE